MAALFGGTPAVTMIATVGLVGTLLFTTWPPPLGAVITAAVIAVVGGITIAWQMKISLAEVGAKEEARREREEIYRQARERFGQLSDGNKAVLERLLAQRSLSQNDVRDEQELIESWFVWWEGGKGRYVLFPDQEPLLRRLVKEWRETAG